MTGYNQEEGGGDMQYETGLSTAKIDYYTQKNGTFADWIASENSTLADMMHARIRSVESQLGDFDRSILELHGRRKMKQSTIAEITGRGQSTISERYSKLIERIKYLILIEENASEIARALRDLRVSDDNARAIVVYLQGAPLHKACPRRVASTICEMIQRVYKEAESRDTPRARLLARVIDARRSVHSI